MRFMFLATLGVICFGQLTFAEEKKAPKKGEKAAQATAPKIEEVKSKELKSSGPKVTDRCAFTVSIGGTEQKEKITIDIYGKDVKDTAKNFMAICTGEGKNKKGGKLSYSGSKFHRIIPQFMLQGGDITHGDGTGGESIYGEKFPDENFNLKHEGPGALNMANAGPNTNGSQFFITTAPTPWLDGHHVVFGRVSSGMNVVMEIEKQGSESGTPKTEVKIVKSERVK